MLRVTSRTFSSPFYQLLATSGTSVNIWLAISNCNVLNFGTIRSLFRNAIMTRPQYLSGPKLNIFSFGLEKFIPADLIPTCFAFFTHYAEFLWFVSPISLFLWPRAGYQGSEQRHPPPFMLLIIACTNNWNSSCTRCQALSGQYYWALMSYESDDVAVPLYKIALIITKFKKLRYQGSIGSLWLWRRICTNRIVAIK